MRQILGIVLLATTLALSSCAEGNPGASPSPAKVATSVPSPTENTALTNLQNQSGVHAKTLRLILQTLLDNVTAEIESVGKKIESNEAAVKEINRLLPTLHDQKLKEKTDEKINREGEITRLKATKTQLTARQKELADALQGFDQTKSTQ